MTTSAPFTSLRLVQLDHLIENATEEAYKDLQNIASSFPNQTDDAKKRALLQHLNATKQRLHRLQVLLQWCHKASAVAECKRVLEVASTHADAFREAADQLVYLHGELIHSKAPVYDVPTAIHVLSSGGYAALPNIIESELKIIAPGKGKNAATKGASSQTPTTTPEQLEKSKSALRRLDFLIRSKLLEEGLPTGMRVDRISNGEAVVSSTSKQYIATISLAPAPSTTVTLAKWTPPEETLGGEQQQQENGDGVDGGGEEKGDIIKLEAMDIDSNAKNTTTQPEVVVSSEASLWRWRLLSFQLLPIHPPALLPPHLVPWLTRNIEDRMWAASDIQQLIQVGKADLVVVPPPPMTSKQRKKKQKEIDDKGRQGLLSASLPRSQLPGSQLFGSQLFGSIPYGSPLPGGTMSGVSEPITTTTAGDGTAAAAEAGAPGVIPIWAQSPLAALHAVLQHVSAKIAIGSVLMEEAKAMENGSTSGTTTAASNAAAPSSNTPTARKTSSSSAAVAAASGSDSGWCSGNLRISKLDERFGVRFSLWPRVPLLSAPELTNIVDGSRGGGDGSKVKKEEEGEDAGNKERKYHHPSLGWILQVEVPPPTYELENKKTVVGVEEEVTTQEAVKKKESTSDGTITCVCVPPLRNAESLEEEMPLSVWSEDGSLSTENLLLRASAQHAQVQLTALQSLLLAQQKAQQAQRAQHLDEVLGVDTWKVDVVDTQTASHAMPAVQCSFHGHAMLLLHFRLTDGQPILSLGPLLTESGVECASEADNLVKKAQIKLNKKLDAVLTEVVPLDTTRSVLYLSTILEAVLEAWKHLVALQRKEAVSIEALKYGFGRATLPRCLEGVQLEYMNSGGPSSGEGSVSAMKETTAALRAPYFTSATLSPPLKDLIPMGKQGSLVCYLLADVSLATAVGLAENFAKRLRLALCWATPGGVPTSLRRLVHVPVEMLVSTSTADANKKNQKSGPGGKATKRKRHDEDEDKETAPASDSSVLQAINWTQLKQWSLENIAVHQLEAQLEAAGCKAQPTEDKKAIGALLSTIPWLSSSSKLFDFTDEEVQFSLDLGRLSHPEEGAFIATFIGKKFSFWKNQLKGKHGIEMLINGNCEEEEEEGAASALSFEQDKIVARCMLQNGKYSAAQLVAKAACVEATTTAAVNIATATADADNISVHCVDLDTIKLKHRDSRASGSGGEITIRVQWRASSSAAKAVNNTIFSGGGGGGGGSLGPSPSKSPVKSPVRSPGIRRLMIGSQSQRFENTQPLEGNASATNNTVVCSISASPQLPAPLVGYLEKQLSVENNFEVGTFLSLVTNVAASAAVVQAVVLDPVAQHAAGLLPGAVTIETFSFETAAAAVSAAAAAVGVCRLLVHQLGRSLQLQMVFQSSGAVMLRARQLPPTPEQQGGAGGGGEVAWLQEAWSRITSQNNITATPSGNGPDEWRHVYVTLLPEQLGTVLTNLLHAVGRK